jgi:hypothetical protein
LDQDLGKSIVAIRAGGSSCIQSSAKITGAAGAQHIKNIYQHISGLGSEYKGQMGSSSS